MPAWLQAIFCSYHRCLNRGAMRGLVPHICSHFIEMQFFTVNSPPILSGPAIVSFRSFSINFISTETIQLSPMYSICT